MAHEAAYNRRSLESFDGSLHTTVNSVMPDDPHTTCSVVTASSPEMTTRHPQLGQDLFLRSQAVLERILLPLLDARTLGCLALTCRGLRDWLLAAPAAVWQV